MYKVLRISLFAVVATSALVSANSFADVPAVLIQKSADGTVQITSPTPQNGEVVTPEYCIADYPIPGYTTCCVNEPILTCTINGKPVK